MKSYHGTDRPNHVRTWRGARYVTCRCSNCKRDFYAEEPKQGLEEGAIEDTMIDDEDELLAAEEAVKRQAEEEDDRRYKP